MKKTIMKVIVLVVIFAAVVLAGIVFAYQSTVTGKGKQIYSKAALPVAFLYDDKGNETDCLIGYTSAVSAGYTSATIVPVAEENYFLRLVFDEKNSEPVEQCVLRVRDTKTDNLIDEQQISSFNRTQGENGSTLAEVAVTLSSLLEANQEYNLSLEAKTVNHEAVRYYCRIYIRAEEEENQIEQFALEFSEATFDKEKAREVLPVYIAPDESMTNDDFGYVNLHSSYHMLTWENLDVRRTSERTVRFFEIGETQTSLQFSYTVQIVDGEQSSDYEVTESFCIRLRNERFYLLSYERTTDCIYDTNQTGEKGQIALGISSKGDNSVSYASSARGAYTAWMAYGDLWCMDSTQNCITKVISLRDADDPVRTGNDNYNIRIIKITDEGDIIFLLYGYMCRGDHEGENGLTLYSYKNETNSLEELFYVGSELPYEVMASENRTRAFVNEDNICYLVCGTGIYAIVLDDEEYYEVTDQLTSEHSVVNEDGSFVAWEVRNDDDEYLTDSILIMNTSTGHIMSVDVQESDKTLFDGRQELEDYYLRVIGFIGDDLVYGVGRKSDVYYGKGHKPVYPLFRINIVDGADGELVGQYQEDEYVTAFTQISGNRIRLTRVNKISDGNFEDAEDDFIILNAGIGGNESAMNGLASIRVVNSQTLLRQYYLVLGAVPEPSKTLSRRTALLFSNGNNRTLQVQENIRDDYWITWSYGRIVMMTQNLDEAIEMATKTIGTVRTTEGVCVYSLIPKRLSHTISVPANQEGDYDSLTKGIAMLNGIKLSVDEIRDKLAEGSSLNEVLSENRGMLLDLSGTELKYLNYYLDRDCMILAPIDMDEAVMIIGYTEDGLVIYDPQDATTKEYSYLRAEGYFDQYEGMYYTILR